MQVKEPPSDPSNEPILHPWTIGAIVVLLLNDQYLKYAYTSWVTGKLSDFAGLIFFPILLEPLVHSRKWSVLLTGMGFASVKMTTMGNMLYNQIYQQFFDLLGWGTQVPLVMDASDCIALLALWVPLKWIPDRRNT
jgi:hypothetical protein